MFNKILILNRGICKNFKPRLYSSSTLSFSINSDYYRYNIYNNNILKLFQYHKTYKSVNAALSTRKKLVHFFSTINDKKNQVSQESSIIPQEVLETMDPATAYAAGFHYFELHLKTSKDKNIHELDNGSVDENSEELSPDLLKKRGKTVMKEIRKQIKAQRRKLMLIDQQQKDGGGDIKQTIEISNLDVAKSLFQYAASKNHFDACVQLGNIHLQNENEINEAIKMYEIAGLKGNHPDGLYNLGNIYYEKQDYKNAILYFEKASAIGDPSATFWLGYAYHRGIEEATVTNEDDTINNNTEDKKTCTNRSATIIDCNPTKALKLLQKAAQDGHNGARVYLAQAYRSSDEILQIEKNDEKMWKYLNSAIEENDGEALYILGDMYYNGSDGKAIDYRYALECYLKSGYEGNHSIALCCAGSMYYNGLGVPRDYMAAFNLYQKSIELDRNNLNAWKNIASMHYFGDGVQEDKQMAKQIHDVIIKNLEEG
jgi:TPR repeat protein